jgi:hypothetical protein
MPIDAAHLHLALTHLPVIGAPFLLLLLTIGLLRGWNEVVTVALALAVGLAVVTGAVYLTGDPAEEMVERAAWFSESITELHEERAAVALAATVVTGLLAAAALLLRSKGRLLARLTWAGLLVSTLLLGWTAWSGGQIRHDEIRPAAATQASRS